MPNKIEYQSNLGGAEDLLLDASAGVVSQTRGEAIVDINKININTIPSAGKFGEASFASIKEYIDANTADKAFVQAINANGGIVLAVGGAGLSWTGGQPAESTTVLAQKLGNGTYRWIGSVNIGSDNWTFRGTVSGSNGVSANNFVTKSQLDVVTASIPSIPSIPIASTTVQGIVERATDAEASAGTDTTRYVTPRQMKAFSDALPPTGGGAILINTDVGYPAPAVPTTGGSPSLVAVSLAAHHLSATTHHLVDNFQYLVDINGNSVGYGNFRSAVLHLLQAGTYTIKFHSPSGTGAAAYNTIDIFVVLGGLVHFETNMHQNDSAKETSILVPANTTQEVVIYCGLGLGAGGVAVDGATIVEVTRT